MKIKGIIREKSLSTRIMVLIGAGIVAYIQIMRHKYFYLFLLVLLVAAVFQKKEHVVSKDGVDIRYELFFLNSTSRWTWDQIDVVQPDYLKDRPNVRVNFSNDVTIRSFLFTPEDAQKVFQLAREVSPRTYVDDFTMEDQEERKATAAARAAEARRQRENAKKNKKKKR